ncbi:MAG: VCBS repeat-containing protein, partial [Planctomycetaceae bacterium]|nr:VCBS repeat-containing protein [Planctomycetaceae bacterium]
MSNTLQTICNRIFRHTKSARRKRLQRGVRPLGVTSAACAQSLESRILLSADFGDAPSPYPTTLAENGARHTDAGPTLGVSRDTEADGTHSLFADADGPDNADGIVFSEIIVGGQNATVSVDVQNLAPGEAARLDAWIDFNRDGAWGGTDEQIFDSVAVSAGINILTFDVPPWAENYQTVARFRLSTAGGLGVTGPADDGEVEDKLVEVQTGGVSSGTFDSGTTVASDGFFHDVYAADINGDGHVDLISGSGGGGGIGLHFVRWHMNDGSNNFQSYDISTQGTYFEEVTAADVDGDGDLDVLAAINGSASIEWYENDGELIPTFTRRVIDNNAGNVHHVSTVDVDGDGDIDVLASRNSKVVWYENDGSVTPLFTRHILGANGPNSQVGVDLDGDGDQDILAANNGNVLWFANDGNQGFTATTIASGFTLALDAVPADFDGDGDLDVAVIDYTDHNMYWLENDGNDTPGFSGRLIADTVYGASEIQAVDMDGDGDMDIVCASRNDNTVEWYENDGSENPQFSVSRLSTNVVAPRSVYAADVDGDGDMDVLASASGSRVHLFTQTGVPDHSVEVSGNSQVDLNGPDQAGVDHSVTFVEDSGPVAIASGDADISLPPSRQTATPVLLQRKVTPDTDIALSDVPHTLYDEQFYVTSPNDRIRFDLSLNLEASSQNSEQILVEMEIDGTATFRRIVQLDPGDSTQLAEAFFHLRYEDWVSGLAVGSHQLEVKLTSLTGIAAVVSAGQNNFLQIIRFDALPNGDSRVEQVVDLPELGTTNLLFDNTQTTIVDEEFSIDSAAETFRSFALLGLKNQTPIHQVVRARIKIDGVLAKSVDFRIDPKDTTQNADSHSYIDLEHSITGLSAGLHNVEITLQNVGSSGVRLIRPVSSAGGVIFAADADGEPFATVLADQQRLFFSALTFSANDFTDVFDETVTMDAASTLRVHSSIALLNTQTRYQEVEVRILVDGLRKTSRRFQLDPADSTQSTSSIFHYDLEEWFAGMEAGSHRVQVQVRPIDTLGVRVSTENDYRLEILGFAEQPVENSLVSATVQLSDIFDIGQEFLDVDTSGTNITAQYD